MSYMRDSTGRRLDSFEVADAAQSIDARKLRAGNLLSRFADLGSALAPADNIATVTNGAAYTITSGFYTAMPGDLMTEVNSRGTFNDASQYLSVVGSGHFTGLDFYLNGDTVEIGLNAQTTSTPIWIYVDGLPMTAAPVNQATTNNVLYTMKLVFPSVARRRIEIHGYYIRGWYAGRATYANLISPAPRRPVVCFIGDSYFAGSSGADAFASAPWFLSRILGVECANLSFGGTGYVSAGSFHTFGSATRVGLVEDFQPELIIMQGSINDNASAASVQAAAAATYAAYAGVAPNAMIDVWGPQPTNDVDTLSVNQATNIAGVKAAALAADNVIAFHDMVGTADGIPPTWASSGQTYNLGDLTAHNGAVYEWKSGTAGNASSPGVSAKWGLVSYALTGTGRVGATASNGTRDTYLYSDDVHPTAPANIAFGLRQVDALRADLAALAGI